MARRSALKRKSFFVDEQALNRAKRVLGVATDAEVVRLSVARITEMERFWRFMRRTRGTLKPGSLKLESPFPVADIHAGVENRPGACQGDFTGETRFRRRLRLDTYRHYPEHAKAIRQWREQRSAE